jgi:hypothetical protein
VTLTYVFCLVRSGRKPRVPAGPPGLPEVRALAAGDRLWLIVASVPVSEFNEAALARGLQDLDWVGPRAIAHEAVVEHFLSAAAVLPMQLFTLFTSDERALEHVAGDRKRIDAILARIERQVEWGLRLTFDEQRAREAVENRHASARKGAAIDSGSAYLARKRDLFDVTRVQLADARTEADRLYKAMAGAATDARRRTATEQAASGSRLLLDAAYLVPAARSSSFRATLEQHTRKLTAAGLSVALTGPWPPYNFIAPQPQRPRAARPAASARKAR